jgi:hypothetical protein
MRYEVTIRFGKDDQIAMHPAQPMPLEDARHWLDQEFVRLECTIARATGKVLFADKLLAVADAAGKPGFAHPAWADQYARAAAGALGRAVLVVDLEASTVGH